MIFGTIRRIITGVFKLVYKLLSLFNLQFALLVLVVGVVLYFCGVFEGGGLPLIIFCLVFVFSIVAAVILTVKKLLGIGKKEKQLSHVQILQQPTPVVVQPPVNQQYVQEQNSQAQYVEQPVIYQTPPQSSQVGNNSNQTVVSVQNEQPRYYRVKQNPNYLMAEYLDRYELFFITPQGLKKVRTDYKNGRG